MRRLVSLISLAVAAFAADTDHPTGSRTTPPTVTVITPRGVSRGTTTELTVEGLNLARASAVLFSQPGVTGRILRVKELPDLPDVRLGSNGTPSTIDLGPLPPRNQVVVEVTVSPETPIGPVDFRVQTPLGLSPQGRVLVEPFYGQSPDAEPNDTPEEAFDAYLPTILTGTIAKPGDVDHYKVRARAGEQLVFENGGPMVGSTLSPLVAILREDGTVLREVGADGGPAVSLFAHAFEKAGTYFVRIADYQRSGRGSHSYRIKVGRFPAVLSAFPLGLQEGKAAPVSLTGYHLASPQLQANGQPAANAVDFADLRPEKGFNQVRIALGPEPSLLAAGTNTSVATAQPITLPVGIDGRLPAAKGHYYRVRARKGQKLVMEVVARRLDSPLDSLVEVLDAQGKPVEQAVLRPVMEAFTTLRDHDSAVRGIRLSYTPGFAVGDYVLINNEVMRIESMPRSPDDDTIFESFRGQRLSYLNTSNEAHAIDHSVYKVQVHPAGSQFPPNGLPITRLAFRNDDGGPRHGKDSYLRFTAPADGDYLVRLSDVRGEGGDQYAYRLLVREPRPDFRISAGLLAPSIPAGGSIPLTVTAERLDDFDGPIEVTLENLPAGLTATTGVIAPGQVSTTLLLSAAADAKLESAAPFRYLGAASINGATVRRVANPEERLMLVSLMPPADVTMVSRTKVVELEPGGSVEVTVNIQRHNGFGGRVPVNVSNLPPRVRVPDIGLNGVLINEDETQRSFVIEALPNAEPVEQRIIVSGTVETRSSLPSAYAAPETILLRVKPKKTMASR